MWGSPRADLTRERFQLEPTDNEMTVSELSGGSLRETRA